MKTGALLLMAILPAAVSAQQPPTGYAPIDGLEMYYEIHDTVRVQRIADRNRIQDAAPDA